MTIASPRRLLETLLELGRETEWLEFKLNKFEPEEAGQYLSGLANSAMLHDQEHAYLVYGVKDTREVAGTTIRLKKERVGSEPFENWVSRLLHPHINFEIVPFEYDGAHVEIVCISPAYLSPVRFKTEAYIRIDTVLKPLREYPERERALWAITSRFSFEKGVAIAHLNGEDVFELFAVEGLLERLGAPRMPKAAMLERLVRAGYLRDDMQGGYDATNLLAIAAARDLSKFPALARKSLRMVRYAGTSKASGVDDIGGRRGYAQGFPAMLAYVMDKIPHKEEMRHGQMRTVYAIPEEAIREFIANALIHQDLTVQGQGPMLEIYSDRIRITNPGKPFVEPERLIDAPARSRNEDLAGCMRSMRFCEERGSGVDRALEAIEKAALAPPLFQVVEDSLVVTVFAAKGFARMSREDRIRACFQHAILRWEMNTPMSNQSLRQRFGLSDKQYPQVSLVIRDTIDAGLIKPQDEDQSNRLARYVPAWVV